MIYIYHIYEIYILLHFLLPEQRSFKIIELKSYTLTSFELIFNHDDPNRDKMSLLRKNTTLTADDKAFFFIIEEGKCSSTNDKALV